MVDWNQDYIRYRALLKGQRLPLAFVDLDRFDDNVAYVAATQKNTSKTIRVASKSVRCVDLIRRIFEKGGDVYQGILAFTVEEAAFLIKNGFDDIVVAYPSVQPSDLEILVGKTRSCRRLALMVDSMEQLEMLSAAGEKAGAILGACLDIDMSYRPVGDLAHIGVRRSPMRTVQDAVDLAHRASKLKGVKINSIMGYEAQIASVNDDLPGKKFKNALFRFIKRRSINELSGRRQRVVEALRETGLEIEVVNGGGSGSLVSTGEDKSVTEVTAGSAFFSPGLFWHFHEVKFKPSAFFALQVVRKPAPNMVTCQGGGYVGSGAVGQEKLPPPVMPEGLKYLPLEGAGEVQTPLILPEKVPELSLGDPIIFQHAKAGELCERFNELHLIQGDKIVDRVKTYRGEGRAFL